MEVRRQDHPDGHLRYEHLARSLQQQLPPPDLVNGVYRDERRPDVDEAGDDGGEQRGVGFEAEGLEEDGGVEHDGIDPGELLEYLNDDGNEQGREARPLEQFPEGMLHLLGLL